WTLAGVGLVAGLWAQRTRAIAVFLLAFLFFSALALCPGFYFRLHYFVLVLLAVSLLAGVAISRLSDLGVNRSIIVRFIPILILGFALAWPILAERKFFFLDSSEEAYCIIYFYFSFVVSIIIVEYFSQYTIY